MTGGQAPTCLCGKPVRDNAYLCHGCSGRVEKDLAEIPALFAEVQTSRLRQSRMGGQAIGGGHSSDRPLPFDERPAAAAREVRDVLRVWSEFVVEGSRAAWPRDLVPDMSRFLLRHLDWLRQRPEAHDLLEQVGVSVSRLRRSVDRPAELTYAGVCSAAIPILVDDVLTMGECPTHLYVPFGRKAIQCPACGADHDMLARREVLLAALEDQLAPGPVLARGLSNLGRPIAESTIRSWVLRKRLMPRSQDELGKELFRVGDVLDLLNAEQVRQAELAVKRDVAEAKAQKRRAC